MKCNNKKCTCYNHEMHNNCDLYGQKEMIDCHYFSEDNLNVFNTKKVLIGSQCPYCGRDTKCIDSQGIFTKSYGMIYVCYNCCSRVGCHKEPRKIDNKFIALGRLANKELRAAKSMAHNYFDKLWKRKMEIENCSKSAARNSGYKWLSKKMNIPIRYCHIGMFNIRQCKEVIELCKPYV